MTDNWRVTVEPGACIGSGICRSLAPQVFVLGDDRVSRPAHALVGEDLAIVDAANCCPVQAIWITELASGRLIAPEE
jgi:ferredoxin